MFTTKKTQLFTSPKKKTQTKGKSVLDTATIGSNAFVTSGMKQGARILSGNGSLKFSSTGDPFVDQFGKLGSYKAPRSFSDISNDCEVLWGNDPLVAVKFIHYLRTITRNVVMFDGTKTAEPQKGGQLKHEAIMRMIWLALKSPETFDKNLPLFVSLGSWHDVFVMLQYDLVYNGWEGRKLDWTAIGDLILSGLENVKTRELVKKYIPQIKANSACKTVESQANNMISKWVCSLLFGNKETPSNYAKYRKLKNSGTAHQWQQLISKKQFNRIDFEKIHGRALNKLVRSKFLKNHGLEAKYTKWVAKPTTNVKYTGFVHELFENLPAYGNSLSLPEVERLTINKQFDTLVEKGKADEVSNFIVVRDTSGSMGSLAHGTKMSCFNIAKALALYFSEFLTGRFANSFIEFNSDAKMHTWSGNNALEKWFNDRTSFVGSTDFQSVIRLFARIKQEGVPESEFPTGIICISDGEFNPTQQLGKTNVDAARLVLRNAGFTKKFADNFTIILWNLQSGAYGRGTGEKFETYGGVPNVYYMSGYSADTISFLTKQEIKTARDGFDAAMDQEILNLIEL